MLALRANYNNNSYHSFKHAVDVMQAIFWVLHSSNLRSQMRPLEILALLISALAHDVSHPGTNNFYHVRAPFLFFFPFVRSFSVH